ncbi:hypothetical protein AAZX31_09G034100 [Glycine max]|uniref:Uncharacterized protein n=2 Tax=Glycine subgen. Soja TaxID=1462606 RepID=C6SWT7_SOYBN|nr:uncharacterized protein LOC100305834 precursor [Glycine max]XP_028180279.1 uncharacterized protein LOC114367319 [Glycine soja]ACU13710.1 unknown [Glycine max]KAG4990400.1 hypothetical protein JHK87_023857 [Glycine soja]KAG5005924.1 hypothetical protein JHK85_024466 [Glycine max]KAG5011711.1 hypothetical protein JHK86_023972 [Glycine max]KAG5132715.1 hypothetical protein JHK82_023903 [Glycine max]|eukprot:NP_001237367.1 uncharacterized protein LOC100305834 precursor [Glycine max]
MRTLLLALLLAFMMMVTMLHAGAVKVEHEQRTKPKRNLLSETSLGRKGMGTDTNNQQTMKVSASSSANTISTADSVNNSKAKKNSDNNGDDDDDKNGSYQSYGPGPVLNSHHYFHIRTPPIHG